MPSTKTTTRTIRIANETLDYFREGSLRTVIESAHHLIESGELGINDSGLFVVSEKNKASAGVCTPVMEDIESMVALCGGTMENFYEQVCEALNEGTLLINNGKVEVGMPSWVERFVSACEDKCLDSEKVGESAVKAIERGAL